VAWKPNPLLKGVEVCPYCAGGTMLVNLPPDQSRFEVLEDDDRREAIKVTGAMLRPRRD